MIPHSRPTVTDADAARVAAVVRSGQLAQGPEVAAFEAEVAARLSMPAAAAVSSGSAALELALRAVDVAAGDEVIVPTYACDALYHAVVRCGARPVLADADLETHSLSAADVKDRVRASTRGIVVPHAFGLGVDLEPLLGLGIPVIEDCAQALGARVHGRPVGGRGTLSVCSFYATKLVTTGEGGVVAGPTALVERVRDGRAYDERPDLVPHANHGLRGNAKLTEFQAALGRSQLGRLDEFIARRRAIAARYREALLRWPCHTPADGGARHVFHRFVIAVDAPLGPVLAALGRAGVDARRPVFRPLHRALGLDGFPAAERLWAESLSLPCYPSLTDADVETVIRVLGRALETR